MADSTYWAVSRSKISKELISQTFDKYPKLPKGATVYYLNDTKGVYLGADWGHSSKQASIALSGSDALRLFYKDNTLKVYYEDLSKPPDLKSVFSLTAVIN